MLAAMSEPPVLTLEKDLRRAIRRGHPWVFEQALARKRPRLHPGQLVRIGYARELVALAYADPGRSIAARILDRDAHATLDTAWVAERARAAVRCRMRDPRLARTNAWRLIHGENDYMPGLVIDLYDDTAVVVFDGPGAFGFWRPWLDAVLDGIRTSGVDVPRLWLRDVRHAKGIRIADEMRALGLPGPPERIRMHEGEARFEVDVRHGHKTGFFLDQRDNRQLVGQLAAGARVLDVCSYAGGFAVHAALGGALQVIAIDLAEPALAAARRNFEASGLDAGDHGFVKADAFEFLDREQSRGHRYDLIVLDPPSFAPNERARSRALEAYRRLDTLALHILEPGGWLMAASCSSHVTTDDSLRVLQEAAHASGRRIRVTEVRGAASDHPIRPGFPEGHYLSFLVVAVD